MPFILDTSKGPRKYAGSAEHNYQYPKGLDLKPDSLLHMEICTKLYTRARESNAEMSKRFPSWKKIDRTLTAYIPADDAEKLVQLADDRKPISIVIPTSYATLETLLTYTVAAFLDSPIFKYEGSNPDSVIGAMLLEKVVEMQCLKAKVALNLHTMFRDGFAYGVGIGAPSWEQRWGFKTTVQQSGWMSAIFGKWMGGGKKRVRDDALLYEGNTLKNVDPYLFLPDPNVSISELQKGEYVGWIESLNYMSLLNMERQDSNIFNVKYMGEMNAGSGTSIFNTWKSDSGRVERFGGGTYDTASSTSPIDVIWMYVTLIPKEWKLGTGEYPEKWLFGMAADGYIIMAKPLGLDHNLYPAAVCAPDFDGYSVTPTSKLEVVYPMQSTVDWFFSSHIANVRKAINDMLIVDPFLVNINDLKDPAPGKLIRLRRAAWGRGVDKAVMQLPVTDITKSHVQDVGVLIDLIKSTTGSVDQIMGIARKTSERVSADESRGTRTGALSRLAKAAKVISLMTMYDIGYMFASHTQQLMTKDTYVGLTGRWQEQLVAEYGGDVDIYKSKIKVTPFDLVVDYDLIIKDGSIPSAENADLWVQLFQIIASKPELGPQFDTFRIFTHIARLMGAKDINEFKRKGQQMPPVQGQVMPDQQVEKQAQAGNLVPLPQEQLPRGGQV